jgi:hypothetical protein
MALAVPGLISSDLIIGFKDRAMPRQGSYRVGEGGYLKAKRTHSSWEKN